MTRKVLPVIHAEVDANRAFPIKVGYSNLQHHGAPQAAPLYLQDLMALRSQIPVQSGVYTTKGLNKANLSQSGAGIFQDGVKYARGKAGDLLEYGASKGIDYASGYAKKKVGTVAKRIRGDGFFRKVLSSGVRGIGNLAADAIGSGMKPANVQRRRPAKGLVYTPEQEMAIQAQMDGSGFFSKVLSGGVRLAGNAVADAIGGGVKKKRKGRKGKKTAKGRKGAGLVAPGMNY